MFFWVPIILALLNAAGVLLVSEFNYRVFMVVGPVLIGAIGYSWWLSRYVGKRQKEGQKRRRVSHEWQTHCFFALPIWMRQIERTRSQTQNSVTAQAYCFSGIVEKLAAALTASQNAAGGLIGDGDEGVVAVIRKCEQDLASVIHTITATQQSRNALFEEVRGLAQYAAELERMAADVTELSQQTTLLAWNGAIEAKHAGYTGNSFSVVASEMRKLSDRSSETGKNMSKRVAAIKNALAKVFAVSEQFLQQDSESILNTESIIRNVSLRFQEVTSQLAQSANLMQRESSGIRDEISEVLTSLQYQDRVSQILSHVIRHMEELHQELIQLRIDNNVQDEAVDAKVDAWLKKMRQAYSTEEQHRDHHGTPHPQAVSQSITYF
jgi:methyl-accepting chemotaxis protein